MLIVTVGAPGSGKSTWADARANATTLRLERDRFREAIFGARRAYHNSPLPPHEKTNIITQAMLAAMQAWPTKNYILSDTGIEWRSVEPFIVTACQHSIDIEIVLFEVPVNVLLHRNRHRDLAHQVPEDILMQKIEMMCDPSAWWKSYAPSVIRYLP